MYAEKCAVNSCSKPTAEVLMRSKPRFTSNWEPIRASSNKPVRVWNPYVIQSGMRWVTWGNVFAWADVRVGE